MMRRAVLSCLAIFASTAAAPGAHAFFGEGYCQKTSSGRKLCVKKENISCKKDEAYSIHNGYMVNCKVSGVITDLAGRKAHWTTSMDEKSWTDGTAPCYYSLNYDGSGSSSDLNSLTCDAAQHFNKVAPLVTLTKQIKFQLTKERLLRNAEELLICSKNNYERKKLDMVVLAWDKKSASINEVLISEGKETRHSWNNGGRFPGKLIAQMDDGYEYATLHHSSYKNFYIITKHLSFLTKERTITGRLNCKTSTQVRGLSS